MNKKDKWDKRNKINIIEIERKRLIIILNIEETNDDQIENKTNNW